jgi:hypothetical protein
VAVFVLAAALGCVALLDEVGPHDEGLVLSAAWRVAEGQLPWRDFWWNYGPGQPVLLGAVWAVLGPSLLWWRILRVLAGAGVAVLAWRLARRWGGDPRWAAAAGVAAGAAMAWPLTPNPNAFALVPGLGAVLLAPRRPGAAGGLAALAAWLRPELGLACALGAAWEARGARGREAEAGRAPAGAAEARGAWGREAEAGRAPAGTAEARGARGLDAGAGGAVRLLAVAAAGTLALFTPFVVAAPGRFAEDLTGFLAVQDLQRLPFPLALSADPNKLLEGAFPALLLAGAAACVAVRRAPAALLPLGAAGLLYLLGRADEFHLVPLAVAVAIAAAGAGARTRAAGSRAWPLVLGAVLAVIALHGVERQAVRALNPPALAPVPGGVGDGVRTTAADAAALRRLVPAIRATRRPVFVAPPRFDRVSVGNPLLQVLLRRPNPTRYDVMQPGVVTTAEVQRELRGDLAATRPRPLVVRWLAPAARRREPNGSARSSGVTLLDDWIAATYEPWLRAGDYAVLRPRAG